MATPGNTPASSGRHLIAALCVLCFAGVATGAEPAWLPCKILRWEEHHWRGTYPELGIIEGDAGAKLVLELPVLPGLRKPSGGSRLPYLVAVRFDFSQQAPTDWRPVSAYRGTDIDVSMGWADDEYSVIPVFFPETDEFSIHTRFRKPRRYRLFVLFQHRTKEGLGFDELIGSNFVQPKVGYWKEGEL